MIRTPQQPLNAFCVDLEDWFHVFCGVRTPYQDTALGTGRKPILWKSREFFWSSWTMPMPKALS